MNNKFDISKYVKEDVLIIETQKSKEETDAFCKEMQPWRVNFNWSNGTKTSDFQIRDFMFNSRPMGKIRMFSSKIDLNIFRGKKVLDVAFNDGYHSFFFNKYLGCDVDSYEIYQTPVDRVSKFSEFIGLKGNYFIADANYYEKKDTYDLILHLGTLYHLQDIWSAIEKASNSLKVGGYLFLETITYEGKDKFDCRFINGLNNDKSNHWALSKSTLDYAFKEFGVSKVCDVRDIEVALLKDTGMVRGLSIYQKI